ncbi:hypothetical protein G7Y89_g11028 [Cudoniella acicularis]|uniref:Uncharacterized protein n=1 Tax=Cudoniella acicularis TaxID=354080 RepID=A0A8H4VYN3_9HELO|nr:hypothetical protein G7Y89_g11028 [Cudoniella acicularis]
MPTSDSRMNVRELLQTTLGDASEAQDHLPEPNDLVFFAEESIRAMDIYKAGDMEAARTMRDDLKRLLQQGGLSVFRRAIIQLLIAEVWSKEFPSDKSDDPRKYAFESMQIVAKLRTYGVPSDLKSAVDLVGKRAEKIGMPQVQEELKGEGTRRKESLPSVSD